MSKHYDFFVIGAGSGGVRAARIAATHGAKVGVAEASDLGGTCVNLGCVPKKLMAYAADYHSHFEDAKGFGWDTPDHVEFDWQKLIERKDAEISRLNGIYDKILGNAGVEIIKGYASFVDKNTLDIEGQRVTADKILIAVGATPRWPTVEGAELFLTSDQIFHWKETPRRAVIVGGGYIAVEFAHILRGIGAHVTLLYRGELFLRGFDRELALALRDEMTKQGVDLRFNTDVKKIEKNGPIYSVHTTQGDILECDLPLAAIGRVPKTEGLNLDNAGVKLNARGQIIVNEDYQTSSDSIYALGDVTDTYNLTPVAIQEGHALADNLFSDFARREVNYKNVATAVFSEPPLSTVGLTEEEALAKGYEIEIFKSTFKPMKHTLSGRDEKTFMKLIVDKETDRVLGIHMMGLDAPEIMQGFAVALNCGATKAEFDRTMAMHPTSAEEFVTMRTPS